MIYRKKTGRRVFGRLGVAVLASLLVLLGMTASPAAASHPSDLNNGVGVQTHIGRPFQPNPPCAQYHTYDADVAFIGANGQRINATIESPPQYLLVPWNEGPDGTHAPGSNCGDAPGAAIQGFTVQLTGSVQCVSANTNYARNRENVTITNLNSGSCHGISTLRYQLLQVEVIDDSTDPDTTVTTVTACNSPIAPQTCLIGPKQRVTI